MLLVVSIIFFYYSKLEGKTFGKYFLCIGIFLLVSSPMLLIKFDTYGDPLYFDYAGKIFTGEFGTLQSVNTSDFIDSDFILTLNRFPSTELISPLCATARNG